MDNLKRTLKMFLILGLFLKLDDIFGMEEVLKSGINYRKNP